MEKRVVLVLAGDTVDVGWLSRWLSEADLILAGDAGADRVVSAGFRPDFLVGDLDSVSEIGMAAARKVVQVIDQDFSDCEKLLTFAAGKGIESAILLGAAGHRVDHMLGTMQAVARWPGNTVIAYERQFLRVLRGPETCELLLEGLVSALPLEACEGVSMSNVRWPLEDVAMRATGFSSLSNFSLGSARISVNQGALGVFWEGAGLPDWSVLSRSRPR